MVLVSPFKFYIQIGVLYLKVCFCTCLCYSGWIMLYMKRGCMLVVVIDVLLIEIITFRPSSHKAFQQMSLGHYKFCFMCISLLLEGHLFWFSEWKYRLFYHNSSTMWTLNHLPTPLVQMIVKRSSKYTETRMIIYCDRSSNWREKKMHEKHLLILVCFSSKQQVI